VLGAGCWVLVLPRYPERVVKGIPEKVVLMRKMLEEGRMPLLREPEKNSLVQQRKLELDLKNRLVEVRFVDGFCDLVCLCARSKLRTF
jgi:hypothetical protein